MFAPTHSWRVPLAGLGAPGENSLIPTFSVSSSRDLSGISLVWNFARLVWHLVPALSPLALLTVAALLAVLPRIQ